MTINNDLIQQIETALGQALSPITSSRAAASDLFEAYILSLIVDAARKEGAKISYKDVAGNTPQQIIFRTSPGYIGTSTQPFTYVLIEIPGKPALECHIGIYVAGKSNVPHEFDVALLYGDEAQTCRINATALPRHSKVLIGVECKFYASGLTLGLGRGFLGLNLDTQYKFGERFFVTNISSASIEKLLSEHKKKWEHDIVPSAINDVERLRYTFQTIFKEFKAR